MLLVDDHGLVLRGLAQVLQECVPDSEVEAVGSAAAALESLEQRPADVALVDIRMPDRDGLDLLREIRERWPDTPVIVLTSYDHGEYVKRALADGAAGYLLKDATPEDLAQAITVARSGPERAVAEGHPEPVQRVDAALTATTTGPGRRTGASPVGSGTSSTSCPRATATGRSPGGCICPRRPSRPTWPPSSASWASATGPRRRWLRWPWARVR